MKTLARLTWMELKLFVREPFSVIFTFAFPLVVLVVIAGVFGNQPDPDFGGFRPADYYLAGYLAVVIAAIALVAVPVHLAAYRAGGILRRYRASGVQPWSVVGAQAVVGLVTAVVGAVVLIVAGTLLYDAALPVSPGVAAAAFLLGTAAFLAVGFLLGGVTKTPRAAQALGMMLFFPMWLLSGAGPPPGVMGEGMRSVSDALPLTHVVRSLQDPWLGRATDTGSILILVGLLVVAGLLAVRAIRRA